MIKAVDNGDGLPGAWSVDARSVHALIPVSPLSVATGLINFVIGHPICFMSMPLANTVFPFDWLTNIDQAPRIFADAYLAFLEITKPSTTATNYTGIINMTSTSS